MKKVIERHPQESTSKEQRTHIFSTRAGAMKLSGTALDAYEDACRLLLGYCDFGSKFSEVYVQNKLNPLAIRAAAEPGADHSIACQELIEHLASFEEEQEVLVPVAGLILADDNLELGRVVFRRSSEHLREAVLTRVSEAIARTSNTDKEKGQVTAHLRSTIQDSVGSCSAVAESRVVAEPIRARQHAHVETERALDLLHFAAPYVLWHGEATHLGLAGRFGVDSSATLVFSRDGSVSVTPRMGGPRMPFEVSPAVLTRLAEVKVFELSVLLQKDEPTDLERRVLRSVTWCARAQTQSEPEFRLLCLISALECLLNPRSTMSIRMGLAEGVAILTGGQDLDTRRRIRNSVVQMYDARSAISHGGRAPIQEADLRVLRVRVGQIIAAVLDRRGECPTQEQFNQWMSDQRIAAGTQHDRREESL